MLTEYAKYSPSLQTASRSASQEIQRFSWNPKVHIRFYKRLPMFSILSQLNAVHTLTPYMFMKHF